MADNLGPTTTTLVSAQVVIGKLVYGRADAPVDAGVLPGNVEEVAIEDDAAERDMALKAGNTRTFAIRNRRWKPIQRVVGPILANEYMLRAFRYKPVSEPSIVLLPQSQFDEVVTDLRQIPLP